MRILIRLFATLSFALVAIPGVAYAQMTPSARVNSAIAAAGYGRCDPDVESFIGTPSGSLQTHPQGARQPPSILRVCYRGRTREVWRVSPTPGGPGITGERLVIAHHRVSFGGGHMWVVPNQAYRVHPNYLVGNCRTCGVSYDPIISLEQWSDAGITLPFVPTRASYFENAAGDKSVGLTGLKVIPSLARYMGPLTENSIVFAIGGAKFRTTQNYIRALNLEHGNVAPYSQWRERPVYFEISYYEGGRVDRDAARIAYLPVFPVQEVRSSWMTLTDTTQGRALSFGVVGDAFVDAFGPLAGAAAVAGAAGYSSQDAERRAQACRDAGGIC